MLLVIEGTIIVPSITRNPDNWNFFLFPLKVQIIGSRLYIKNIIEIIIWYTLHCDLHWKRAHLASLLNPTTLLFGK